MTDAEKIKKLVEFVKTISNENKSKLNIEFYAYHADRLLREIGEKDK